MSARRSRDSGAGALEQLEDNVRAVELRLSSEDMRLLDESRTRVQYIDDFCNRFPYRKARTDRLGQAPVRHRLLQL